MLTGHLVIPIPHPLSASIRVPGSKSLTNRALMVATLADGTTTLDNALFSDDSHYFVDALVRLGFTIKVDESNARMTVEGRAGMIPSRDASLFVGNAGTAARFLTAMLTLGQGVFLVDGDSRMRQRPIGDLVEALSQLGAKVEPDNQPASSADISTINHPQSICLPLRIVASRLPGGRASLPGNLSSQFLSGLLMTAPYAQNPVEIIVTQGLNSKPYVDMTIAVMGDFGVTVERDGYKRFFIQTGCYQTPGMYAIESDASAASYFFAAPAVCGGTVRVENISRRSKQGDIAFLDVLAQMGCTIREEQDAIEVTAPLKTQGIAPLHGVDVDMGDISDTAQTLAAIAPFASTPTTIRGIASARIKETDRVTALVIELTRLGVTVAEHPDGLTIQPCAAFQPTTIQTYNDHRMAMAFALVGLRVPGIAIENPGCVSKTFPNYFHVLDQLRVT